MFWPVPASPGFFPFVKNGPDIASGAPPGAFNSETPCANRDANIAMPPTVRLSNCPLSGVELNQVDVGILKPPQAKTLERGSMITLTPDAGAHP
jgi:hypothetical protein